MRNTRNSLKILLSYTYYIAILAKAIYYGMSKSSDHLDRALGLFGYSKHAN